MIDTVYECVCVCVCVCVCTWTQSSKLCDDITTTVGRMEASTLAQYLHSVCTHTHTAASNLNTHGIAIYTVI